MFKYSGSLVGVSIWVGCSRFGLYVCTRVHLLGQFLWTVLAFCAHNCNLGQSPESMECCCSISWVSICMCFILSLLQSGNFIPFSVTKASCTSRVIAMSPQAFSIWAPDPCPWWSRCFCSSLSEIPRWHRTEKSESILYLNLSDSWFSRNWSCCCCWILSNC